ncbi:MAG TPA: DUF6625 family protein [Chthoniobacterales bacterium]
MTSPDHKIALFTAWFGGWKGWINLHLETCARNPGVTWFFLHDQPSLPANRPPNVRFVRTSLADIALRYERLTGRPIRLAVPYKACDLKPLFGPLFPELLAGYSWWGYCDNDLLCGDIGRFVTAGDLSHYDVITSHVCTIIGQFTIFRGLDLPRRLFFEIPDIETLLADPEYRGIDELLIDKVACAREAGEGLRVSRRMLQVWERLYEPSWEEWASKLESGRRGSPVEVRFLTGACEWRDGRIFHAASGTETMFFHFLEWKRRWRFPPYPWPLKGLESIRVDEQGFHFHFTARNRLQNLRLRFCYDIPFRFTQPVKNAFAKAVRGWRKLLRALRPAT